MGIEVDKFWVYFPKLGWIFNISPTLDIFGLEIRWYALFIVTGMILAVSFCIWDGKGLGVSSDTILDIALISIPSAIIGARLYYVIFMWDNYKDRLGDIFKIWEGGLAIYGGIIAGVATGLIYCHIKKIQKGALLDLAGFGFLIGQSLGRWGNFMNGEAYGGPTDLPWGMVIQYETFVAVHPTFLYESLWNILGFIMLFLYRKYKKFNGEIFLLYVTWYGLGRAWIEGLRADSLYLFNTSIRVSQLLAIIAVIAGVSLMFYKRYKMKRVCN